MPSARVNITPLASVVVETTTDVLSVILPDRVIDAIAMAIPRATKTPQVLP